jgi:hypothetical protein
MNSINKNMIRYRTICTCGIAITFSTFLFSQTERQLLPSELKQLTEVTEPPTLNKGFLKVGLFYNYVVLKSVFNEEGDKFLIPGSLYGQSRNLSLDIRYGLTDRIQINATIPYSFDIQHQSQNWEDPLFKAKQRFVWTRRGNGIGDLSLGIDGQIIKEHGLLPSITAKTGVRIPTGEKDPTHVVDANHYDLPTGTGEAMAYLDIQAKKLVYPYSFLFIITYGYHFGGNKIYDLLQPEADPVDFKTGDLISVQAGAHFHLNDWLSMANDLVYSHLGKDKVSGITTGSTGWVIAYQPWFHFQVKKLRFVQSVEIPLRGKNYPSNPGYFFAVQYII